MKPVLLYDGTLLASEFSRSNSDRTGVFFVAYNLLLHFLKQNAFEIVVYVAEDGKKNDVARAVSLYGFPEIPVITQDELKNYHVSVYFQPALPPPPPPIARNPTIARYAILYDVTPLALPDIEAPNAGWFEQLTNSLNGVDHYFAISEYTKKDFLRFFPALDEEKMFVTPLAASSAFFHCTDKQKINAIKDKYHIPRDKPYVFSLCTLQPRKNLVHAVKCFIEFVKENNIDGFYFVLAGGHWDIFIRQLDDAIDSQGEWKKYIVKTGYVDDEDLAPLYSDALFTVYVSLYEGFGLPVLEAMQCGCPVITSDITSMPEVIGDAGITVDPYDPVALKKAYKKFFFDSAFRETCAQKGLERAKNFSWEKCASQILAKINLTFEQAIKEQRQMQKRRGSKTKTKPKRKLKAFGKMRTENATTLYFLYVPIAKKTHAGSAEILKIFGMPVKKTYCESLEKRTTLFNITTSIVPNYEYIDSQVDLYVGSFNSAMYQLGKRLEKFVPKEDSNHFEKELEKIKFYTVIKDVENGKMSLESELKAVDKIVQKLKAKKDGDNDE